jgi:hypothetical protein
MLAFCSATLVSAQGDASQISKRYNRHRLAYSGILYFVFILHYRGVDVG